MIKLHQVIFLYGEFASIAWFFRQRMSTPLLSSRQQTLAAAEPLSIVEDVPENGSALTILIAYLNFKLGL